MMAVLTVGAAPRGAPARPADVTGAATVLDGDTLQVQDRKVRLFGVDAFEAEQTCADPRGEAYPCGGRATRYLSRLVAGQRVSCAGRNIDPYGRLVAVCRVGSTDLGAALVRAGHAVAFRRYSLDYVGEEQAARTAKAEAWAGRFVPPADYRVAARGETIASAQRRETRPSGACVIKGNLSRRGDRIYHLPSDPYYGATRAEAMFCSSAQAEAAGFRRAGRPRR